MGNQWGGVIPPMDRFLAKVEKTPTCWIWTGSYIRDRTGDKTYGQFWIVPDRYKELAHRASYFLFKGEIPDNMFVCHTCNNKKCVNPDHLVLGTPAENSRQAISAGLITKRVLTEDQVLEIRNSNKSFSTLARQFNVSLGAIQHAYYRRSWKWL